jgi:hypothetical protein
MATFIRYYLGESLFEIGLGLSLLNLGIARSQEQELYSKWWKNTILFQQISDGQFLVRHLTVAAPSEDFELEMLLRKSTINMPVVTSKYSSPACETPGYFELVFPRPPQF